MYEQKREREEIDKKINKIKKEREFNKNPSYRPLIIITVAVSLIKYFI